MLFNAIPNEEYNYRHVFEEKVAPVILDVKQESDDDTNVDQADQHHNLNIKKIIYNIYIL